MSASGLDVFDRSLETTHIWLNEICIDLGPDKQVAGVKPVRKDGDRELYLLIEVDLQGPV